MCEGNQRCQWLMDSLREVIIPELFGHTHAHILYITDLCIPEKLYLDSALCRLEIFPL